MLAAEDVRRLLAGAEGWIRSLLVLAVNTGLRSGELAALRWRDIDLETGTLHVAAREGGSPKSHRDRLIPLNDAALDALREQRASAADAGVDAPVFSRQRKVGAPWNRTDLSREVRQVFEIAGLYDRRARSGLHQLRRTFASTTLSHGASIECVRQLGGWSDLSVVQRYLNAQDREKREAVSRLTF